MSNLNLKSVIQSTQSYVNQVRCRDVSEVFRPSVYKLHHPARPMEFPLLNGLDEEDGSRAPKNGCHHAPEDGQDGRHAQEDVPEVRHAQEDVPEVRLTQEDVPEVRLTQEDVPDVTLAQDGRLRCARPPSSATMSSNPTALYKSLRIRG